MYRGEGAAYKEFEKADFKRAVRHFEALRCVACVMKFGCSLVVLGSLCLYRCLPFGEHAGEEGRRAGGQIAGRIAFRGEGMHG